MAEGSPEGAPRSRDAVRRFLLRLVRDEALAEDLVQEVFLRAHRTPSRYRGEASERSWPCALGLNLVRDHYRASRRNPAAANESDVCNRLPSDADEGPGQQVMATEMTDCIAEFVVQLPQPQCDVVALHDAGGLTHPEIAVGVEEVDLKAQGVRISRLLLKKAQVVDAGPTLRPAVLVRPTARGEGRQRKQAETRDPHDPFFPCLSPESKYKARARSPDGLAASPGLTARPLTSRG